MNWQLACVMACVAWAAWLVLRRVRKFMTGTGESGCSGCPKTNPGEAASERIITADQITIRRD